MWMLRDHKQATSRLLLRDLECSAHREVEVSILCATFLRIVITRHRDISSKGDIDPSHNDNASHRDVTSYRHDAPHTYHAHHASDRHNALHEHDAHVPHDAHQAPRVRRVPDAARDRVARHRLLLPQSEAAAHAHGDDPAHADHRVARPTTRCRQPRAIAASARVAFGMRRRQPNQSCHASRAG